MKKFLAFVVSAFLALAVDDAMAQSSNTPAPMNDCSGSVTTGGTAVNPPGLSTSNLNRNYLFIENPSATVSGVTGESLFANADNAASSAGSSQEMTNLGSITFSKPGYVPTGPISIVAATSGHKFVCKWN